MATPTSRAEFGQYCLRKLGYPVLEINVSEDQIDDRIDEALKLYMDFHFDGSTKEYYAYQLTSLDFTNKYVTLPANIIGAVRIFNPTTYFGVANMFNVQYQIALNDYYTLTSTSMVPYYQAMSHIQFLEQLLIGEVPVRYNRKAGNKLYLDMNWNKFQAGQYIIVEAAAIVDPDTYTKVWSDYWLMEYATALIQEQWGANLSKFKDINLIGGVRFNGDNIKQEAKEKIKELREELMNTWSEPPGYLIG